MIRLGKNIGFAILISVLAIGGCWHFFNFQNDSLVEADSLQGCASGEACPSGTACNNTVCCPSGYCGWGDNVYFVRECVASGQIRENSWASLICRSGIWKVRLNGWGCNNSAWGGCDEGWCQTFGDAGFCRSCAFDSGLAQGCANGEACPSGTLCNNTVCCPSGTCGYGDGLVFGRQCVASGEIRENLWGRQICRNGVWKTLVGGWGCDLFGECESGSCQKIGGYHYCISSLPFSSAYTSTAYNTGMYCQGTCRTCASEGNVCGNMSDNCGGTIYCGDCSSGQTCASGQCVSSCVNDCSSSGAKQCGGNGFKPAAITMPTAVWNGVRRLPVLRDKSVRPANAFLVVSMIVLPAAPSNAAATVSKPAAITMPTAVWNGARRLPVLRDKSVRPAFALPVATIVPPSIPKNVITAMFIGMILAEFAAMFTRIAVIAGRPQIINAAVIGFSRKPLLEIAPPARALKIHHGIMFRIAL